MKSFAAIAAWLPTVVAIATESRETQRRLRRFVRSFGSMDERKFRNKFDAKFFNRRHCVSEDSDAVAHKPTIQL